MNHQKLFLFLFLLIFPFSIFAKEKLSKALITVTSYSHEGKLLKQGKGFFINSTGTALASFDIFKNAAKAEVKDSKGKIWQVSRIEGVSDIYDVVKFRTDCEKSETFELSDSPAKPGENITLYCIGGKKSTLTSMQAKIIKSDNFNGLTYYTIDAKSDTSTIGMPIQDSSGRVVGILQPNAKKDLTKSFALDISVAKHLYTSALSAGQTAFSCIYIPKQLPSDTTQAASYIYLLAKNSEDTLSYLTALQDYKQLYPANPLAYVEHARFLVGQKKYAEAEAEFNEALQQVTNKADIHYNLSKIIYQLNMYKSYEVYNDWNLDKALAEAKEAYALSPLPLYLLQQGDCHFALKQYQEAFDAYQALNKTTFASAQTYFYAARSRELFDNDTTTVLALMDSAMHYFPEPYPSEAGPYLFQRAQLKQKYQKYKEAAFDYDAYEKLVGTNKLNDNFFYIKEQNDLNANFYAWALSDIEKALQLRPKEYLYLVEKAVIQLQVGDNEEAIYAASEALKVNPKGSDAFKVLGIAYGQKNDKAQALKYLQQAKELGDTQVDHWIQKLQE